MVELEAFGMWHVKNGDGGGVMGMECHHTKTSIYAAEKLRLNCKEREQAPQWYI